MSKNPSLTYVFDATRDQSELKRLQAIETVFDPATKRRMTSVGIVPGWRCLEVEPGAGSILHWLADTVGNDGWVTGVDINPRFLTHRSGSNWNVIEGDIRNVELGDARFDLIHSRYVLIHLADHEAALERMFAHLKPSGWIVLEEPDFSAARPVHGPDNLCQSAKNVNHAIMTMFTQLGMDYAIGLRLPHHLQEHGFQSLRIENDAPLVNGNTGVANIMKMSARQLREKYLATGDASEADIDAYCHFADDVNCWGIYYATIGVVAQLPHETGTL